MASLSLIESAINRLPAELRGPIMDGFREAVKQARIGAPSTAATPIAVPAENLGGHLVPFVTSPSASVEVAVAHQLGRVPRLAVPVLHVGLAGAQTVPLTVTRAADEDYVYVSSPTTSAQGFFYIE